MRRALSSVLVLALALGLVPAQGLAAVVGAPVHQCAHGHGEDCSCGDACKRPPKRKSVPEGPACHREKDENPDGVTLCRLSCSGAPKAEGLDLAPKSLEPPSSTAVGAPEQGGEGFRRDAFERLAGVPQPPEHPPRLS
ncbi:MAG: hypothetical protein H6509_05300 [Bryobacterales bacterium]|nr:hypothetical protein [Bryobacterales bacterium]